jgi:ribosomal protein S27AE
MSKERYYLFANGTDFMEWQARNCEKCVKAVFYDEKKDRYPNYRCAVQKHIEEAAITDGCGNKRDYEATHSYDCPYKHADRKRKMKKDPNQLMLELEKEEEQ